jgi:hypothetical protein
MARIIVWQLGGGAAQLLFRLLRCSGSLLFGVAGTLLGIGCGVKRRSQLASLSFFGVGIKVNIFCG